MPAKSSSGIRQSSLLETGVIDQAATLACPFQKSDPFRHQRCFGARLRRIKDVKQHVYRCHSNPEHYCAACYQIFDTAVNRDRHSRQRVCQTVDNPSFEQFMGINEDQRKKLSERSIRTMSEEEQWYQIWNVLFPNTEEPRSAYQGDFLKDLVPVIRQKWAFWSSTILKQTSGMDAAQVGLVVDAFFGYLEGEIDMHI
ncbi:hypothetical protein F5883DRAFT_432433 [Diaporthe sp. PMI_573]|nr:hypothetical protein F5883DRAFT_432433 [Diaporthaceae sp. PMI_573]